MNASKGYKSKQDFDRRFGRLGIIQWTCFFDKLIYNNVYSLSLNFKIGKIMFDKSKIIFWPVGTGDSTSIVIKKDIVLQVDLNNLEVSDDKG